MVRDSLKFIKICQNFSIVLASVLFFLEKVPKCHRGGKGPSLRKLLPVKSVISINSYYISVL